MYGEIVSQDVQPLLDKGLPPCVRGNLIVIIITNTLPRSTPVCTGKSIVPGLTELRHTVYPRVYGEIQKPLTADQLDEGLPPCVRGNPSPVLTVQPVFGSTPVCTGKSLVRSLGLNFCRVYPRVYGEIHQPLLKK